ncbi:hypothetical protein HYPSUDRAFT_49789, partial [Hypholoma sublateritium FD-334 SS-4]
TTTLRAPYPSSSTGVYATNGSVRAGSSSHASTPLANVTWLRKTEYISRKGVQRSAMSEQKRADVVSAPVDVSRNAQLCDIEASCAACNENFSLETLQHLYKPNATARSGDRPIEVHDPRLDCAILRPMKTEHDSFLAFYLTQGDESALSLKETRFEQAPYEVPENEEVSPYPHYLDRVDQTTFHFVRDYETVKVEQKVLNEFLLVLSDGDSPIIVEDLDLEQKQTRRDKGAYNKNIERKMHLEKKRVNIYDQYDDKSQIAKVMHAPLSAEETEREEALAEVAANYWNTREDADADADADAEVDDIAEENDTSGMRPNATINIVSEL